MEGEKMSNGARNFYTADAALHTEPQSRPEVGTHSVFPFRLEVKNEQRHTELQALLAQRRNHTTTTAAAAAAAAVAAQSEVAQHMRHIVFISRGAAQLCRVSRIGCQVQTTPSATNTPR